MPRRPGQTRAQPLVVAVGAVGAVAAAAVVVVVAVDTIVLAVAVGVVGVVESVHRRHRLPGASVGNVCSETDHRRETRRNPNKLLKIPP